MSKAPATRFEMRMTAEMIAAIDDWRRRQTPIPSQADAVRRLLVSGLRAEGLKVGP